MPGFENSMCGISTEITEKKKVLQELKERIKEQRCLYNVSKLGEQQATVPELLQATVENIAQGFQYPDITEVAITFDNQTFTTEGFQSTEWKLEAKSNRVAEASLDITVVYTEHRNAFGKQPFIDEEQKLIDSISDALASKIDRIHTHRKLSDSKDRWKKLVNNDPDLIQITEPNGTVEFINPSGAQMFGKEHPDEIIGRKFTNIVDFDQRDIADERTKKLLNGEKVPPKVFKMTTHDGTERYLRVQSVLTTLENGDDGIQNVAEDITDRVNYEKQLKESLNEKETLLQEIHHRVKNNLAVVSGMMELQTFKTDNEEVRKLLANSKNRIKTMALIHEKLYQSESLSKINFGGYVEDLAKSIEQISAQSDDIELDLEYDSFNLNVNQAVPCAIIINEVMANAYEHGFDEGDTGRVSVSLKKDGDTISISISNNGEELPADFKNQKSESIGYTIIETLVLQLEAELDITSNDEEMSVTFSFERQDIKGSSSSLVQ